MWIVKSSPLRNAREGSFAFFFFPTPTSHGVTSSTYRFYAANGTTHVSQGCPSRNLLPEASCTGTRLLLYRYGTVTEIRRIFATKAAMGVWTHCCGTQLKVGYLSNIIYQRKREIVGGKKGTPRAKICPKRGTVCGPDFPPETQYCCIPAF